MCPGKNRLVHCCIAAMRASAVAPWAFARRQTRMNVCTHTHTHVGVVSVHAVLCWRWPKDTHTHTGSHTHARTHAHARAYARPRDAYTEALILIHVLETNALQQFRKGFCSSPVGGGVSGRRCLPATWPTHIHAYICCIISVCVCVRGGGERICSCVLVWLFGGRIVISMKVRSGHVIPG